MLPLKMDLDKALNYLKWKIVVKKRKATRLKNKLAKEASVWN